MLILVKKNSNICTKQLNLKPKLIMKRIFTLAAFACFFALATSCNQPETVKDNNTEAEEMINDMGDEMDNNDVSDEIDNAVDETGDAIDEAVDETSDAIDEAGNELDGDTIN